MEYTLDVPQYDPAHGVVLRWEHDADIAVAVDGDEVVIRANADGLLTLARAALALATAPPGSHVHLDDANGLLEGSAALVVDHAG